MSQAATAGDRAGTHALSANAAIFAASFGIYLVLALADGGQGAEAMAAMAIGTWWALAVGIVLGARTAPWEPQAKLAVGGLVLLAGLIVASASWASDDGRVGIEAIRVLAYLGAFLLLLTAVRAGQARTLMAGLAAALAAVAMLALGARIFPELLTGDRTFLQNFPDALRGRLSYPVGYWNGLAATMAGAAVLLAWFGSVAREPAGRALAVAMLPAVTLTIYLTGSRGGLLAAIVGLVVFAALTPVRARALAGIGLGVAVGLLLALAAFFDQDLVEGVAGRSAEWPMFVVVLIASLATYGVRLALDDPLTLPQVPRLLGRRLVAGLAIAAAVGLFAFGDGAERLGEFESSEISDQGRGEFSGRFLATAGNGRYQLWETALDAAAEEPLHGVGAGAFGYYWNQNGTTAEPARDAHSLFLEALAELGPLGLIGVMAFFAAGAWGLTVRTFGDRDGTVAAAAGLLAAAAVGVSVDWNWEIPAATVPTLLAVAVLCARPAGLSSGPASARRGIGGWALLALALAAVTFASSVFLSEQALDRSRRLAAEGDLTAAATAASDATRLQPASATPWIQLGRVQALARDFEGSVRSFEEAVERAPESPQANVALAIAYVASGDPRLSAQLERLANLLPADR